MQTKVYRVPVESLDDGSRYFSAKAQELSNDIDSMLTKGGFSVKGWISNKDLSKGNEMEKNSDVTEVFAGGAQEDKVLGVVWNHGTDELRFKLRPDLIKASDITGQRAAMLTKRMILSKVAHIYSLNLSFQEVKNPLHHQPPCVQLMFDTIRHLISLAKSRSAQ